MNLPPPPPPRPDLAYHGVPEAWRVVSPGQMNAPAVVGAGVRLWAQNWLPWGLVTLAFAGILSVALAALNPQPAFPNQVPAVDDALSATEVAAILLTAAAGLVLVPWLSVILTRSSLRATFAPDPGALIGRTIRGVPSLLWIYVILFAAALAAFVPIAGLAAGLAFPLLPQDAEGAAFIVIVALMVLVTLLWLLPRLALVVHMYVAEDRRGTGAIAEAWRRTRQAWWMVLGTIVLNILIGFAISLIPTSIANTAFPDATVADAVPRAVIVAFTNALVTPLGVAITTALYLELSARKGVLSQETLERNLARFDDR